MTRITQGGPGRKEDSHNRKELFQHTCYSMYSHTLNKLMSTYLWETELGNALYIPEILEVKPITVL